MKSVLAPHRVLDQHHLFDSQDLFDSVLDEFVLPDLPEAVGYRLHAVAPGPEPQSGGMTAAAPTAPAGGAVVTIDQGGMVFNLIYDAAAMKAPAAIRAGIEQAAAMLSGAITDRITVNFQVDVSGTGRGADGGPDSVWGLSYSKVHDLLSGSAAAGDRTFASLPSGSSIDGRSLITVTGAQVKLFTLYDPELKVTDDPTKPANVHLNPNDPTTDDAGIHLDADVPNPVAVALHELTNGLGRMQLAPSEDLPPIFDFYRYTAPGVRLYSTQSSTSPAAYFSLDGGKTKLADYGQTSDPADFLNTGVQGPRDPFNEFGNEKSFQFLTMVDLAQIHAIGFHTIIPGLAVAHAVGHGADLASAHPVGGLGLDAQLQSLAHSAVLHDGFHLV